MRVAAAVLAIALLASGCADSALEPGERVFVQPSPTPVREYVVESGDTLGSIAARFGTTIEALAAANSLADPNAISVGQQLTIARPGETNASVSEAGPCEGYRRIAAGVGGLLARLGSDATDFAAALRHADRVDAELRQLPWTPAYQALESAIDAAAVTASAAGLGRSADATSALGDAWTSLDAALDHLEGCTDGEAR